MPNKRIEKIPIDSSVIIKNIENARYSINKLANEVGYSSRQIRNYINKGEMPKHLFIKIDNILKPKKHAVWMRVGMTVYLTDDELDELMELAIVEHPCIPKPYCMEVNINDEERVKDFLDNAEVNGETYIPACIMDEYISWYINRHPDRKIPSYEEQ